MLKQSVKDWSVIIGCFFIGIMIALMWNYHNKLVKETYEKGRQNIIQEYSQEYVEELRNTLRSTQNLNEHASKRVEELTNENTRIDLERRRLERSLLNRPYREEAPRSAPSEPSTPSLSCTGSELYREDGEFLTGEAARADKLIAERDFYWQSYENARKELENLKQRISNGEDYSANNHGRL